MVETRWIGPDQSSAQYLQAVTLRVYCKYYYQAWLNAVLGIFCSPLKPQYQSILAHLKGPHVDSFARNIQSQIETSIITFRLDPKLDGY